MSCHDLPHRQDFYPLQRWRRLLTLRAGPSAAAGELDDLTTWRSLKSARDGADGYLQPELGLGEKVADSRLLYATILQTRFCPLCAGVNATQIEVIADTTTQSGFTHGRCPREPSSSDTPLQSEAGKGCLMV